MRECAFLGEFISMEKMPKLFTASTSILLQRFFPQMHFVFKNIKNTKWPTIFCEYWCFQENNGCAEKRHFWIFSLFWRGGVHGTVHQWPLIPLATENHNKNLYKKLDNSNKSWHKSSILGLDTRQTVRVPAENFSFKKSLSHDSLWRGPPSYDNNAYQWMSILKVFLSEERKFWEVSSLQCASSDLFMNDPKPKMTFFYWLTISQQNLATHVWNSLKSGAMQFDG